MNEEKGHEQTQDFCKAEILTSSTKEVQRQPGNLNFIILFSGEAIVTKGDL